ncbi:MAG: efflux RND transporter periplasmic adaptor subunit [Desulfobacterales bacterium]|nr:efflux RND transporter periplasmic adaptor subunit [Desulfobacterales bacterium]
MTQRTFFRWIITMLLIAAIGIFIWFYTRAKPVKVVVKPVERGLVEKVVANTRSGTVKAFRRANLSPSLGGQIAVLDIKEGDKVRAGQLLIDLWNEDLVAEVALSKSEAEAAKARAKATCLQAEIAQREADRLLKLLKTGAASEEKTDRALTDAKVRKAECEAAIASAGMSLSRVEVVKANLERTRLIAPFDGIIAEITGELNEYVTPSPPGIPTPPAVVLIDDSSFYVVAPIDEVDAPGIALGMPARVRMDAFGNQSFEGKVRRIAAYVLDLEKQARTVDVEVEFINHKDIKHLLAGYSADIEVILDVHKDTLRIPTYALLDNERVFVYHPDSRQIEERTIKTGISNWDYTEVITGLKAGELVITTVDREGIKDGAKAITNNGEK